MHSLVNGAQSLSESDWLKFLGAVRVWPSTLETIISYIGKTRSFDQIGKPYKELVQHESHHENCMKFQVCLEQKLNELDTSLSFLQLETLSRSIMDVMVSFYLKRYRRCYSLLAS